MSSILVPKYQVVNGFKFNRTFQNVADSLTYEARPDDLFIATYPKNGTSWTQLIVTRILNDGHMPAVFFEKGISGISPFLERNGKQAAIDAKRPCAIKYHLPYNLAPKHPEAKTIVVLRNAKDTCVSFYYHQLGGKGYDIEGMDFHDFFHFWLKGEVECGDYFDFILSWWKQRDNPHLLILLYEEMKTDAAGSILKIAKFMDQDYAEKLKANNDEILNRIVRETGFEATKEQLLRTGKDETSPGQSSYARKGIIGDWKNHMTEAESDLVDKIFHQKLDGTGLEKLWDSYDIFSHSETAE